MSCNLIQRYNAVTTALGKVLLLLHCNNLNTPTGQYPSTTDEMGHSIRVLPSEFTRIRNDGRFGNCIGFDRPGTMDTSLKADEEIGTADYTVEFWVRFLDPKGAVGLFSLGSSSGNANTVHLRLSTNRLQLSVGGSSPGFYTEGVTGLASSVMPWSHIAVTRKKGVYKLWYNGKMVASGNNTVPILGTSFIFGKSFLTNSAEYSDLVDEVRLVKGVALYDADFTPSQVAFGTAVE